MYICTKCYYSGSPVKKTNDNSGLISGFISAVLRAKPEIKSCLQCSNEKLLALNSNEGKHLLDSITK